MISSEQVIVEHQEIRILTDLNGALGGLDAKLLRTVDGKSQQHFLNAHPLVERRKYSGSSVIILYPGFLASQARHSDFHAKIRIPGCEISEGDIIAGPGHDCAGVPNRFAAELL
jgi:hypothetical protein